MDKEKRTGETPIPENLEEVLNAVQLLALRRMEGYGWALKFVRRPLFQSVVPVLLHAEGDRFGILEDDGTLNSQPDIRVREYGASSGHSDLHQV